MYTEITTREVRSGVTFLSRQEHGHLIACLKYCRHRLTQHKNSGMQPTGVPLKFIDAFLTELELAQ